jgi:hypothetical protein
MAFPNNRVKRRNRRALGRGQVTPQTVVGNVVTGAASTVTINFAAPVQVLGTIPITVATLTIVSQTVVSPTQVTILMSGALAGHAWSIPNPMPNVSTYEGGVTPGGAGTF